MATESKLVISLSSIKPIKEITKAQLDTKKNS